MSWRDQLRKASFRGVEFLTHEASGGFGRRTVTHEYPLRDKPYVEDLGRKARTIELEAFVLATAANGFNYMPRRDALIAALEEAGPGVLVHPYLGELRVSLTESKLSEKTAEGGMARFALTFVEAGEVTFPSASENTPSIVNSRADAAEEAVLTEFSDQFSIADEPAFVADAAKEILGNATTLIGSLPRLVPAIKEAMAEFVPNLSELSGTLDTLMQTPSQLGALVLSQIDELRDLAENPVELLWIDARDPFNGLKMLRKLFDFGEAGTPYPVPIVPATTPSRIQQADNQQAITALVQRAAVITAVRASSDRDFAVFQDAQSVRTELADRLDTLLLATGDDDTYNALVDLRTAMVNDLTARGADLARLVNYTPAGTLPALTLAYDLYEDASRDGEIVSRNRVQHPGFVRGGRPLQVLADV
jgi:prophage DNA circulation protein